ncbi:MAG TPA: antibiotic biosynthesis monooxygenase [Chloroflexota bacterium]|jgi:quinol monooxygenase YgiN
MSVTVVLRLRARPGQADAVLAAGTALYQRALQARTLQAVRVLQGLADPDDVLVLGEWQKREAYWAARAADQAGDEIVALCAGPPQRYFFDRLGYYEDMSRRAWMVAAAFMRAPAATAAAFAAFLTRDGRQFTADAPGLVYRYVYQDADDPTHFLLSIGLASQPDWEHFQQALAPPIQAAVAARGGTLDPFAGRAQVDTDLYGGT